MTDALDSFLDWAPIGHARTDGQGRISTVNRALRDVLGYDSAAELVGAELEEMFHHRESADHLRDVLRSGREARSELNVLTGADGSPVPVLLSCRQISLDDGGRGLEIIVQDVRERVTLEQELRQAQKLDAVGRLAGGMAHDFNNLLMIVQGRSELALASLDPGHPAIRHLYAVHRTAAQAESLTRQLLAFSRNQTLQFRTMSVNEVLSDTRDLIHRWLGEDIVFRTDMEHALWPVKGDPVQIQQVIVNLVLNARDAMPHGGTLRIRTANVPRYDYGDPDRAPEDSVMLEMRDTGRGMDKETQALVFEPFFTTKKRGKGTGLGLSTAYGVIKQSGGSIQVESAPDRGTTFRIYLPRTEGAIEERRTSLDGPGTRLQPISRPGVVLLVEDQHDLRLVIRSFLEDMGHHVIAAADAEAVLTSMGDTEHIDLLLTDVVLPSMSGPDLALYIRSEVPDLPVIFISGFLDHPLVNEIHQAGERFLAKPFTRSGLEEAVSAAMDSRSSRTGAAD